MDGHPLDQTVFLRKYLWNLSSGCLRALAQSYVNGSKHYFHYLAKSSLFLSSKRLIRYLESKWNSCFRKIELAPFCNVIISWWIWLEKFPKSPKKAMFKSWLRPEKVFEGFSCYICCFCTKYACLEAISGWLDPHLWVKTFKMTLKFVKTLGLLLHSFDIKSAVYFESIHKTTWLYHRIYQKHGQKHIN